MKKIILGILALTLIGCEEKKSEHQIKNDIPEEISLSTLNNCLRTSEKGFTNSCNFTIAFTYCFNIGKKENESDYTKTHNLCSHSTRKSPAINSGETFPFPIEYTPIRKDRKYSAGLVYKKGIRIPK